ncbi:FolC bifunctional protein [Thelephora terrestris]|uniref:Folylpolyglutamate synthase n=1 Tax=Thelephora terrestris TaxID=56493 RepID=A0A9P6HAK3_9AGAM|nr:FolC bifunctional protein [Thelephora terrestris]
MFAALRSTPSHPPSSFRRFFALFHPRAMSARSYSEAVDALNSLQSNAAVLEALRASGGKNSSLALPEMLEYLHRIGYSASDLNKLNVIHITGTKGKGSTSAFTDSILRQTKPEWKVGLYTSPHLVAVRERIRINSVPLSEEQFSSFFFEVWDRLDKNQERTLESTPLRPAYFRMMTLVAFHAFLSLGVDATVLEVGVGGKYDSTNIVPKPVVTGITALGLDHVSVLGKTIGEIAWQKAGIYKEGVPAFTVEQPEEGMTVLEQVAGEKASSFSVVKRIPEIDNICLGIPGSHQYQNAALAAELSRIFLKSIANLDFDEPLPEPFRQGLANTRWPGRCQTVQDPVYSRTTWFLDGAHTHESLEYTVKWFVTPAAALREKRGKRVLIFNCTGGRSGAILLQSLLRDTGAQLESHKSSEPLSTFFDTVIFCTNVTYADGHFKGDLTSLQLDTANADPLEIQTQLADAWSSLIPDFPKKDIHILPSIEHAIRVVRGIESGGNEVVDVLATGSLLLVGGVIEVAGLADVAL